MNSTAANTGRQWTPQQQAAIDTVGHSLLVSAAAGSGKTAVLTERCAHLVCDAAEPCGVDELLVVTFTEAAAAEMRTRVRDALAKRVARSPGDERIVHQLASIERATIGTLHSFCGRLLRQHFHAAGLDPDFAILDGNAAALMKRDTARQLVAARFATDGAPTKPFAALLDGYFNGDDGALAMEVLSIYETLTALPDPARWLRDARQNLQAAATAGTLKDSAFGKTFTENLERDLAALADRVLAAQNTIRQAGDFPGYLKAVDEAAQIASHWQATLASPDGLDALSSEAEIEFPRLPTVKNGIPGKEIAQETIADVRKELKEGPIRKALKFTQAQWRDGMAAILAPAEELLSLVEAFTGSYALAKERVRSLDFSDLERRTFSLLTEAGDARRPSRFARACHQRFKHVLVDEYQDINDLQESILKLVSRECLRPGPAGGNLFCVGDVKQSIYRFRAAEPRLFLERYDSFKKPEGGGEVIDLSQNFRSRAPLLGAINEVFERLMTPSATEIDYAAGHRLVPGATFPNAGNFPGAPIELHLLPAKPQAAEDDEHSSDGTSGETSFETERAEREAMFIAHRIKAFMGEGGSPRAQVASKDRAGTRDVRFGDFAILLRTRKFKIEQYANVLRMSGIPVLAEGGSGFFSAIEVMDVLSLLRLLDNIRQDLPLAAVLRSPLGGLPEPEDSLARIRLAYPADDVPFHVAAQRYADDGKHDDELAARLRDIFEQLGKWRELAQRRPLAEVIAAVYEQSGYLAFVCGLADGAQRKANLLELHRRAAQFGQMSDDGGGLSRFLNFLEQLADEVDAGQASVGAAAIDAVQIVTVHKSKGLEFPVVFVADLGKKFNLQDASGPILVDKDAGLGLQVVDEAKYVRYPSLATTVIAPRLTKKMLAEELRVLYVALTRAEEHLILVGTPKANAAEKWQSRWSAHGGPLPDDAILRATTPLDWLGPVAVAAGADVITMTEHDTPPTAEGTPVELDTAAIGRLARFAALKPSEPAPPSDAVAGEVIARLNFVYPHRELTVAAAAQSVTKRAHAEETLTPANASRASATTSVNEVELPKLPQPRFVAEHDAPNAADAGTATHLVLEHFDFHQPSSSIPAQIAGIVDRRLMPSHLANSVDVESIRWLLGSKVGRLLAEPSSELFRELPVFFAAVVNGSTAPPLDPRDRVMVRGRVDLFVRTAPADFIIDYKTDRVSGTLLDERIAAYRAQLTEYANAIESAVTKRKPAIWLVFLSKRRIVEL